MTWETVIGLEVHVQLKTQSKLFSSAPTQFGATPNAQTNFIDAALPGVLPVLNRRAIEMAIQFGLAVHASINQFTYFERKNYFYPDLPKGYQISQFQHPIVFNGHLNITLPNKKNKTITIQRAHLEEDAGKSLHDAHAKYTGIDLNRAGTPLLEVVTTPCLSDAEEAVCYLKTLHQLVRFLGICDGNMQEGSFRCDVNLSIRKQGEHQLGTRTELKNINSFRFIEKAIQYEAARHQELLENGQSIIQETRLYNPDKNQTESMRSKENENDYRYFPDPDLLPIQIRDEEIQHFAKTLPPLPSAIRKQLADEHALNEEQIEFLLLSPATYAFYTEIVGLCSSHPKTIVNWLKGHYTAALNERGLTFEATPLICSEKLAQLFHRMDDNTLGATTAKKVFLQLIESELSVDDIIQKEGFQATQNNDELETLIKAIIEQNPAQASDYRAGKEKLLAFFVGQIMKQTKGKASPSLVNQLLIQHLSSKE